MRRRTVLWLWVGLACVCVSQRAGAEPPATEPGTPPQAGSATGVPQGNALRPGISPEATEAIRMIDSGDSYQQQYGFLRLEALREPATIGYVRGFLRHDQPALRALSVRALAAIGGAAAMPEALDALTRDRDAGVRRAALLGLEPFESSDPHILPAMLAALRDRHPDVRITAVDAVSRVDNGRAREAILERNRREHDRNVRRALELAMKRLHL